MAAVRFLEESTRRRACCKAQTARPHATAQVRAAGQRERFLAPTRTIRATSLGTLGRELHRDEAAHRAGPTTTAAPPPTWAMKRASIAASLVIPPRTG
jgi:hypothetical protein